jgi:hypothetical protein
MARPTIEQLRSFDGITAQYRWNVLFVKFPSIGSYPDTEELNLRCTSAELPKTDIATTDITIRGIKAVYPVNADPSGTITLSFIETEDMTINKIIDEWQKAIYEFKTGITNKKKDIEGIISLYLLDGNNNSIYEYKLLGCFLQTYNRGTIDAEGTGPVSPTMTFQYDYFETKKL